MMKITSSKSQHRSKMFLLLSQKSQVILPDEERLSLSKPFPISRFYSVFRNAVFISFIKISLKSRNFINKLLRRLLFLRITWQNKGRGERLKTIFYANFGEYLRHMVDHTCSSTKERFIFFLNARQLSSQYFCLTKKD